MARIRTIKPGFFRHFDLYTAERETGLPLRVAFAGLWTAADREGRFEWKPAELKLDCLPFDSVPFERVLESLAVFGFVARYAAEGKQYGYIPSWPKHQVINQREAKSVIPAPPDGTHVPAHAGENIPDSLRREVFERDGNQCVRCKASADLTVDHIFPRSMGGTHALTNLRTLCRSCNSARPVAGEGLVTDLARDGLKVADRDRMCAHVPAHGEQEGEGKGTGTGRGGGTDGARAALMRAPRVAPGSPADWDRRHNAHALRGDLCGWVCLPEQLFVEFVGKMGADEATGRAAVRTWALGVKDAYAGRVVAEGDVFKFWRNEWTATHGGNRPAAGQSLAFADPLAGVKELERREARGER